MATRKVALNPSSAAERSHLGSGTASMWQTSLVFTARLTQHEPAKELYGRLFPSARYAPRRRGGLGGGSSAMRHQLPWERCRLEANLAIEHSNNDNSRSLLVAIASILHVRNQFLSAIFW